MRVRILPLVLVYYGHMTCRHGPYDPACSSYESSREQLKKNFEEQFSNEKDASNFVIEAYEEKAPYLLLRLTYPSCSNCSYEGTKLMVFKDVTLLQVMQWRKIDPHFRDTPPAEREAPSPVARFPATPDGKIAALIFMTAMLG